VKGLLAPPNKHPCQAHLDLDLVCGKTDDQKPMTFRGTDWCCDDHWKMVLAQRSDDG
jgi:hypothetical protein